MEIDAANAVRWAMCAQSGKANSEAQGFVYHMNTGTDTEWIHRENNADDKSVLIIAFNGSNTQTDWNYNLFGIPKCLDLDCAPAARCHAGFVCKYLAVRDELLGVVDQSKAQSIVITGHSLGGALATLCALDVQHRHGDRSVTMHAFGAPKVGDRAFRKCFNNYVKDAHVYVFNNDFIESVPPCVLGYVYTTPVSRLGRGHKWWKLPSRSDHNIDNYAKALQPKGFCDAMRTERRVL